MHQQMTIDAELWDHLQLERMAREDLENDQCEFFKLKHDDYPNVYTESQKEDLLDSWEYEYYLEHGEKINYWHRDEWEQEFYPVKWMRDEDTLEGYWEDML